MSAAVEAASRVGGTDSTGASPRLLADLLSVAQSAAAAGTEVSLDWQSRRDALVVDEKAASDDLVSQADRETEDAVCRVILAGRPDDSILGEERGERTGSSGTRWVIDPIDGTTNYLYGRPDWAVSVAALDDTGRVLVGVVMEPMLGRTTHAVLGGGAWCGDQRLAQLHQNDLSRALVELNLGRGQQRASAGALVASLRPHIRDIRRGGSAAVALAQVATGRADAAWLPGLRPWDCAAGVLLVTETGGVVGDLSGRSSGEVPESGDVLAGPPALWPLLRDVIAPAYAQI
jgi:myo-inositol-1(or 4)-monophosphatase